MTYNIKTRKGYDGWEAVSETLLGDADGGQRILKLRTSKLNGRLAATASVSIRKNSGAGFMSETTEIFGDFYKRGIAETSCSRVTEKSVLDVHKRALLEMDALIDQAKAFYEMKARKVV